MALIAAGVARSLGFEDLAAVLDTAPEAIESNYLTFNKSVNQISLAKGLYIQVSEVTSTRRAMEVDEVSSWMGVGVS